MAEETTTEAEATVNDTQTQTETAEQANTTDAPSQETPAADPDGLPNDPEQLKALIRAARSEAAKTRVNAKQKAADQAREEVASKIAQALGLAPADQPPTVDQLTQQLAESQAKQRAANVELAVYKAANGLADVDMLLDSNRFHQALADVDPTDVAAIKTAVTQFVTENPKFKPIQVVGSSTVEHPAGSGEGKTTLDQFRRMNGEQRNQLFNSNPDLYRILADQI